MNPYRPSHGQFDDYDALEADDPNRMETDFDLLHKKFDQSIRASLFCGGMFGLLAYALIFAIAIYILTRN